jgi:crossover junction endodeoxyribonuclease RuvC
VLGIDPGSRVTGYGVVEWQRGRTRYVASGCIRTHDGDTAARLAEIYSGVATLIETHRPAVVAVEQVFLARNASSAIKLGQARGVALAAAAGSGLPVSEYAARRVKQALTGTGAATKEQMQHMVKALLRLSAVPMRDAADALAIAICHINTQGPLSGNGRRVR